MELKSQLFKWKNVNEMLHSNDKLFSVCNLRVKSQSGLLLIIKAETHDATRRGDKSLRLHCCCDKSLALSLSLRYVAQIQTTLNLCDRSQRQWFSHVTRGDLLQQPVAATCRSDLSHRLSRPLVLITFLWLLISWEYFNRSVVIWYIPRYTGGVLPAQKSWVGVCSRLPKTPNPFMTKIWNLIYDHCSWAEKLYPLRLHIPI